MTPARLAPTTDDRERPGRSRRRATCDLRRIVLTAAAWRALERDGDPEAAGALKIVLGALRAYV